MSNNILKRNMCFVVCSLSYLMFTFPNISTSIWKSFSFSSNQRVWDDLNFVIFPIRCLFYENKIKTFSKKKKRWILKIVALYSCWIFYSCPFIGYSKCFQRNMMLNEILLQNKTEQYNIQYTRFTNFRYSPFTVRTVIQFKWYVVFKML